MVMEERRGAELERAWEGTAQAQTSLSAYRSYCLFLRLHCPSVSTKRASQQTCSVCTPSVRLHNRTHTQTLRAGAHHTVIQFTHHPVSQAPHTKTGVYFSLQALCPLPSALSSYQAVLVSTEATSVPIPLFPGLAPQACKMPASYPLPEHPIVLLGQTGSLQALASLIRTFSLQEHQPGPLADLLGP